MSTQSWNGREAAQRWVRDFLVNQSMPSLADVYLHAIRLHGTAGETFGRDAVLREHRTMLRLLAPLGTLAAEVDALVEVEDGEASRVAFTVSATTSASSDQGFHCIVEWLVVDARVVEMWWSFDLATICSRAGEPIDTLARVHAQRLAPRLTPPGDAVHAFGQLLARPLVSTLAQADAANDLIAHAVSHLDACLRRFDAGAITRAGSVWHGSVLTEAVDFSRAWLDSFDDGELFIEQTLGRDHDAFVRARWRGHYAGDGVLGHAGASTLVDVPLFAWCGRRDGRITFACWLDTVGAAAQLYAGAMSDLISPGAN
ncbi:hypothetical protein [Paraburkholderia sp.]|uniref:hypothetical protein n=1 Tax=Paraburkholderia sp. TaxID=1926495 RepID=UPI002D508FE3|nr:hypothetical protein [Paraburkholderia sp.]HZZ02837.1 hypothetical protein [Paraburkholderia sp.]